MRTQEDTLIQRRREETERKAVQRHTHMPPFVGSSALEKKKISSNKYRLFPRKNAVGA
jgi:hypothetical protein